MTDPEPQPTQSLLTTPSSLIWRPIDFTLRERPVAEFAGRIWGAMGNHLYFTAHSNFAFAGDGWSKVPFTDFATLPDWMGSIRSLTAQGSRLIIVTEHFVMALATPDEETGNLSDLVMEMAQFVTAHRVNPGLN